MLVLDRPRHEQIIKEVRAAGARIKLISDGDVGGAIEVAKLGAPVDVLFGIGGTPEGSHLDNHVPYPAFVRTLLRHSARDAATIAASPAGSPCRDDVVHAHVSS